jgi:hypothetical protein
MRVEDKDEVIWQGFHLSRERRSLKNPFITMVSFIFSIPHAQLPAVSSQVHMPPTSNFLFGNLVCHLIPNI